MNPVLNDEYRRLMRGRLDDSVPKRTSKVVELTQNGIRTGIVQPISEYDLMRVRSDVPLGSCLFINLWCSEP